MANVELDVRSQLGRIVEELKKIQEQADQTGVAISKGTESVGKGVNEQVKKTEGFMGKLGSLARRTADQLRRDFLSLGSIKSLQAGLSLSNQFGDSIQQTITLSDTIRKLGTSFGIARKDFAAFQDSITKGMGDVGMSSEDAAAVMKDLAGSGVKGQGVIGYAQTASQLASLGGESGQSGKVAAGLASVVRAQGRDVNDPKAMQAVAQAVTKAMEGTGASASEILRSMDEVFQAMPTEMRKAVTPEALTSFAAAETVAGPGATAGFKKYLSMDEIQKKQLETMGFGKAFTKSGGLDVEGLKKFGKEVKALGLDMRTAFMHAGFDEGEAEGMVRLVEGADRVTEAMTKTAQASEDYAKKTRQNMTLSESFGANINKVKGAIADTFGGGKLTQGISDALGSASETTAGAVAVTGGGAILSALLTGGGISGLKNTLLGQGKREAYEAISGKTVQDVYVMNAGEIGDSVASKGLMEKMGGVGGLAKGALGVGAAGTAGWALGTAINEHLIKGTEKETDGMNLNAVERFFHMMSRSGTKHDPNAVMGFPGKTQEVHVKLAPGLAPTKNSRGAAYGPYTR
jgi:hypothetical protein